MNRMFIFAVLLMFGQNIALAEGSVEAGKQKSVTCAACHGADGNSVNPAWPRLAGQNQRYLIEQLEDFKEGNRQNPLMTPQALMLSGQDISDLAAFYEAQISGHGEADAALVPLGQKIYRAGVVDEAIIPACYACHGPNGRGVAPAGYPALGGQHAIYIEAQLRAFRSGARRTDPDQQMRNVAARLSDEEIIAVASFLQGLH
ncbi:MAG: c-type cytochrome [Gammaproteobacteria bacterium]|nr:c-type cytochrome [Gammaproteobacteria bacterium]MCZ6827416.1 c-type cytochrome [Gammaproteobacteria bacterium]